MILAQGELDDPLNVTGRRKGEVKQVFEKVDGNSVMDS